MAIEAGESNSAELIDLDEGKDPSPPGDPGPMEPLYMHKCGQKWMMPASQQRKRGRQR